MRAASLLSGFFFLTGSAAPLAAQGWASPQHPCDLSAGHFRVVSGQLDLKLAAEKPDQRGRLLAQGGEVLVRAITEDKQDKNPAAWYYLGRYYTEVLDAGGADTAFARAEELAPQCKADIATYRGSLAVATQEKAGAAWQAGKRDSAILLFRLAGRLAPSNPRPLVALAALFAEAQNSDSAVAYYRRAANAADGDTSLRAVRHAALTNAAEIYLSRAEADSGMRRGRELRASRDSLERALAADSAVLDRLTRTALSRHKRQARLAPADQQAFQRDSSTRADAVTRERAGLAALRDESARVAGAARATSAPAISALRDLVAAYPDDVPAATNLAMLYAESDQPTDAAAVFDSLSAHALSLDADDLILAGERLLGAHLLRAGARALVLGLAKNPYRRDALFYLASASYALRDSGLTLSTAQRLIALDPLNRSALRLVAAGWDLEGQRDSTHRYMARADSALPVDVTVSSFTPDSAGFVLTAIATNLKSAPTQPFRLSFEFLGPGGRVAATVPADIAALAPGATQQFELHVKGREVLGWRYRPL